MRSCDNEPEERKRKEGISMRERERTRGSEKGMLVPTKKGGG